MALPYNRNFTSALTDKESYCSLRTTAAISGWFPSAYLCEDLNSPLRNAAVTKNSATLAASAQQFSGVCEHNLNFWDCSQSKSVR